MTTTLEIVEGHRTASSGTVRVFGANPADRRAVRPRVGIMLQEGGFLPDFAAAESLRLIGRLTGRSDSAESVLDVVDLAGMAEVRRSRLSGGEKRRLDFATAVYGRPELILLDEPTTGLDLQSRDVGGRAAAPRGRRHDRADNALSGGDPTAGRPDRTDAPGRSAPRRDGLRAHPRTVGRHPVIAGPAGARTAAGSHVQRGRDVRHRNIHSAVRPEEPARLGVRPRRRTRQAHRGSHQALDDVFRAIGAAAS